MVTKAKTKTKMKMEMETEAKKIDPEAYILSALSPEERLETALKLAQEAFKDTPLTLAEIEAAVKKVRRKVYAERQKEEKGGR